MTQVILALAAFTATLLAQHPRIEIPDWKNAVRFEVVASQEPVRPGDSFEIALVAEIRDGYHLYGPEEPEPSRTVVSVSGDSLRAGKPVYPTPIKRNLEGLGEYHLYEGQLVVRVPVTLPDTFRGANVDASVDVAYQICTDYACSAPTSGTLSQRFSSSKQGTEVKKLYPEIFKKK